MNGRKEAFNTMHTDRLLASMNGRLLVSMNGRLLASMNGRLHDQRPAHAQEVIDDCT